MYHGNWKDIKDIMSSFSGEEEEPLGSPSLIIPVFSWASLEPVNLNESYIKTKKHLSGLVEPMDESGLLGELRFNFVVSAWKEKAKNLKNLIVIECVLGEESEKDGPPYIEREKFEETDGKKIKHLASLPTRLFDLKNKHKHILYWLKEEPMPEETFRKEIVSWLKNFP